MVSASPIVCATSSNVLACSSVVAFALSSCSLHSLRSFSAFAVNRSRSAVHVSNRPFVFSASAVDPTAATSPSASTATLFSFLASSNSTECFSTSAIKSASNFAFWLVISASSCMTRADASSPGPSSELAAGTAASSSAFANFKASSIVISLSLHALCSSFAAAKSFAARST